MLLFSFHHMKKEMLSSDRILCQHSVILTSAEELVLVGDRILHE